MKSVSPNKKLKMSEIEEVKEDQKQEPKLLEDILKRHVDSQKEMMDVLVTLFVRLEAVEKKLSNPLLAKLLE